MKTLLLGCGGQVGHELWRTLPSLGPLAAFARAEADLENLDGLRALLRAEKPDVVVNAAAYTAVDKAESEPGKAMRINAEAVGVLAEETARADAWLVHYSTDYVFDGAKTAPYVENDPVNPLGVYGLSKLKGEEAVAAAGCKHLIFRTSWVYAPHGRNFPKTILRLAAERDELKVVADQVGAPTAAELIAEVTAAAVARLAKEPQNRALSGLYHLAAGGETSWHGFARHIVGLAKDAGWRLKTAPERIYPIPTADYPTPARRPANSRLATGKLKATFGVDLPPWEHHAARFIAALPRENG